jgi:hypothetical protein
MKRIIALVLCVVFVAFSLASCELLGGESVTVDEAKAAFAEAIEALASEDSYKSETKIEFVTENEEMSSLIESVGGNGITVWRDGDNFKAEYAAVIGDKDVKISYVLVEDKLYRDILLYVGDDRVVFGQECADFSEGDKSTVLRDAGAGVGISLDDFENITPSLSKGKLTISATGIDKSAADSLVNILKGRFSGSGASVIISDDIGYSAVIEGGKISSTSISCNYTVIIGGETYVLDAVITESYTYTKVSVSAPSGAANYTEVDLDKLI